MEKPRYLYHGSPRELIGDKLAPGQKTVDLGEHPENLIKGVYASDMKEYAIAMALVQSNGVQNASVGVSNGKLNAIVYRGWPESEHIYLYTLKSTTFHEIPKGSHQWVSLQPVKPIKIEKMSVQENLYVIRKATSEELEAHNQKFGKKIEELKKKEKLKI
jgi:hypothetical protein